MTNCLFTDEIAGFVLQLFHMDKAAEMENWQALSPIELGVLSWHLGNFYGCPCSGVFGGFLCGGAATPIHTDVAGFLPFPLRATLAATLKRPRELPGTIGIAG